MNAMDETYRVDSGTSARQAIDDIDDFEARLEGRSGPKAKAVVAPNEDSGVKDKDAKAPWAPKAPRAPQVVPQEAERERMEEVKAVSDLDDFDRRMGNL